MRRSVYSAAVTRCRGADAGPVQAILDQGQRRARLSPRRRYRLYGAIPRKNGGHLTTIDRAAAKANLPNCTLIFFRLRDTLRCTRGQTRKVSAPNWRRDHNLALHTYVGCYAASDRSHSTRLVQRIARARWFP